MRSTFLPKLSWIWRWFPRSCVHLHPFLIWYWYLAPGKPINYARKMAILKGGFWDFTIEKPKTIIVNGYFSSIINGFSGGKVSISNQEWMQMNTWTWKSSPNSREFWEKIRPQKNRKNCKKKVLFWDTNCGWIVIIFEIHDAIPFYFAHKLTFCWNIIHGPQKKTISKKGDFSCFHSKWECCQREGQIRAGKGTNWLFLHLYINFQLISSF